MAYWPVIERPISTVGWPGALMTGYAPTLL